MRFAERGRDYYINLAKFTGWIILVITIVLYFGIPILQVYQAMFPPNFPIGDVNPSDLGLDYQDVTLTTEDDLIIHGWYIPSSNQAAVILAHAFNGNRTGMIYHAELLAKQGYGVLLYDTRSEGESEGDLNALGWEDHLDVFAAMEFLRQRPEVDPERIGVLGLSAGAKTVLYAATQMDDISAVVAEGTRWRTFEDLMLNMKPKWLIWIPADWASYKFAEIYSGVKNPDSLQDAVKQMPPTPLLLITAEGELPTSQVYYDLAPGEKQLWKRDEQGHQIDALFDQPDEYKLQVVDFFDQHLLGDQ